MNQQVFHIAADDPCLNGHFPDEPIVPGVVLLDRVIEAVQVNSASAVIGIARCKFIAALYPGQACTIEWNEVAGGRTRFVCSGPDGLLARGVLRLADQGSPDG